MQVIEKEISGKEVAWVMVVFALVCALVGGLITKSFIERTWIHPDAHVLALEESREAGRKETSDRIDLLNSLNRRVEGGWTYIEETDSLEWWREYKPGTGGGYSAITRLYTYQQAYDMAAEEGWLD